MSHISRITCCPHCGHNLAGKPAPRPIGAASYRDSDDFLPAYSAACQSAAAAHGAHWRTHGAAGAIYARVPAAWVRIRVYKRTIAGRRDLILPGAAYWPAGAFPIGAEIAAPASDRPLIEARYLARCRDALELQIFMARQRKDKTAGPAVMAALGAWREARRAMGNILAGFTVTFPAPAAPVPAPIAEPAPAPAAPVEAPADPLAEAWQRAVAEYRAYQETGDSVHFSRFCDHTNLYLRPNLLDASSAGELAGLLHSGAPFRPEMFKTRHAAPAPIEAPAAPVVAAPVPAPITTPIASPAPAPAPAGAMELVWWRAVAAWRRYHSPADEAALTECQAAVAELRAAMPNASLHEHMVKAVRNGRGFPAHWFRAAA